MKKSLFLCVLACLVLTRPVFAEWIPCSDGVKEGDIDGADVVVKCGSNYNRNTCYYNTSSYEIDCNHTSSSSCSCPSGYSGTCTGTNYSTCYKSCYVKCDPSLTATGCPSDFDYRFCVEEVGIDTTVTCYTGKQYYGSSTCVQTENCACKINPFTDIRMCPDGYQDCGKAYNVAKGNDVDSCCKTVAAGTYVKTANGSAVLCEAGHYCPGGNKIYYGSIGGQANCPTPGTSGTGKSAITDCYIPKGTPFSDETGSGKYTADCYYQ